MKIEYVHKMGYEEKPFQSFEDIDIPERIKNIILNNSFFSESTIFGKEGIGSPDEIEILKIEFDNGEKKEFQYFNKGIHFMMTGGDDERPIFQVFTYFMMFEREK